jgi:hypothetical protein
MILPYDDGLEPWADLCITNSDQHISWEDCTWQTATYCGLNYDRLPLIVASTTSILLLGPHAL